MVRYTVLPYLESEQGCSHLTRIYYFFILEQKLKNGIIKFIESSRDMIVLIITYK